MKLVKLLLAVGVIVVGVILWSKYSKQGPTAEPVAGQQDKPESAAAKDAPRVEEKYGFTSEGLSP